MRQPLCGGGSVRGGVGLFDAGRAAVLPAAATAVVGPRLHPALHYAGAAAARAPRARG